MVGHRRELRVIKFSLHKVTQDKIVDTKGRSLFEFRSFLGPHFKERAHFADKSTYSKTEFRIEAASNDCLIYEKRRCKLVINISS